ncbi:MAG: carboxypeptidase regulatory-like domain-containing protein [Pseudomonadota bacterium]
MKRWLALLALAQACAFAVAQSATPTTAPAAGGASNFQCGGVGEADQKRIKAEAGRHDLMLTFAVSNGAYLADVDVRIVNAKGQVVVEGRCSGPIMLVDLPAKGSYKVTAQAEGRTQTKTVNAGGGTRSSATLVWPVS